MNQEERRKVRERVRLHRLRKEEAQALKQEQEQTKQALAEERAELVDQHGEQKVLDREHYNNQLVPMSLELLNYLTGRKTTWLKIDSPTLNEDMQSHFDHLEKEFSNEWYHGHLDNNFEKCARMGLLPFPKVAARFFRDLYNKFKGGT